MCFVSGGKVIRLGVGVLEGIAKLAASIGCIGIVVVVVVTTRSRTPLEFLNPFQPKHIQAMKLPSMNNTTNIPKEMPGKLSVRRLSGLSSSTSGWGKLRKHGRERLGNRSTFPPRSCWSSRYLKEGQKETKKPLIESGLFTLSGDESAKSYIRRRVARLYLTPRSSSQEPAEWMSRDQVLALLLK